MAIDLRFLTRLADPQHHAVPCRSRTEEVAWGWVRAATVEQGTSGHQRSPTVQRIAGRWPCSSRSRDDAGERFGLWSDGGEGSSASPVTQAGTDESPGPTGLY